MVEQELSQDDVQEIERHKYFLSEQAGHDVGWDHAQHDWLERFANVTPEEEYDEPVPRAGGLLGFLKRLIS